MMVVFGFVAVLAAIPVVAVVLLWIVYAPVVAKRLADMPWFPSRRHGVTPDEYPEGIFESEPVWLETEDGQQLAATYLPTTVARARGIVIFCHEVRGSRWSALTFTGGLRDAGFDVLTFDFRNHGQSSPQPSWRSLPWATDCEATDIRAAIDWCARRHPSDAAQIILFGLSRGASAAFCVGAGDPRVQALVLDSMVPTEDVQLYFLKRFMYHHVPAWLPLAKLPDWLLRMCVFWANRIIAREHGRAVLPISRVAPKVCKPTLVIHGGRDVFAPLETVCQLRKEMRVRPRMWVISQAKHNETVHEVGEEYRRRVTRFLLRHAQAPQEVVPAAYAERLSYELVPSTAGQ